MLPVSINTPIPQESVEMWKVGIEGHVHVVMQLVQVYIVPVVVDVGGSLVVVEDVALDIVGGYGFFRIFLRPALDKQVVEVGFGRWSTPQLLKMLLDRILQWPRYPKMVGMSGISRPW